MGPFKVGQFVWVTDEHQEMVEGVGFLMGNQGFDYRVSALDLSFEHLVQGEFLRPATQLEILREKENLEARLGYKLPFTVNEREGEFFVGTKVILALDREDAEKLSILLYAVGEYFAAGAPLDESWRYDDVTRRLDDNITHQLGKRTMLEAMKEDQRQKQSGS